MTDQPNAIYLKDYEVPEYLSPKIDLEVDIYEDKTFIKTTLEIIKNTKSYKNSKELKLNGERMEFVSLEVNGKKLNSSEYVLTPELLQIPTFPDKATVVIHSSIQPQLNTSLEGFYKSGNIFCTQCEPEGFRKITYSIDRPDNMCSISTLMKADKNKFPYLLSNGNLMESGELPNGRHWAKWKDPYNKPAYLFAMVAGDLEKKTDTFVTMTGRNVKLEFFVDHGQGYKTPHAIESLKNAMKWDEKVFGLEYDLDIYMVVAVESFNFGAMENKGLNIFNSAYVLADQKTATDGDFLNIEGVIGHEYFHNWTGNRVTCRDWFQLTLKEGLTVYRDQEFSSDMQSRAVKRIEDVRRLKESQFPEDQGPLSHPIRPSSYIEINNFYTATVYEKGAEVIRMLETFVGRETFNKGIRHYLKKHDGQAVTTEDFVAAHEEVSGKDLTQFKNWYKRPGTPTLKMDGFYSDQKYKLTVEQIYPQIGQEKIDGATLCLPLSICLFSPDGKKLIPAKALEITKVKEEFVFDNIAQPPIPSFNRNFTAPVIINYNYNFNELLSLAAHDDDPYVKAEAAQVIFHTLIKDWVKKLINSEKLPLEFDDHMKKSFKQLIEDSQLDSAFKSLLWTLPSESQVLTQMEEPNIDEVHEVLNHLEHLIGSVFYDEWKKLYFSLKPNEKFEITAKRMGERSLRNRALNYLLSSKKSEAFTFLEDHYQNANNMTDQAFALSRFCKFNTERKNSIVIQFYEQWKHEPLVMLRWFGSQVSFSGFLEVFKLIEDLEKNPVYRKEVPNDIRSLYASFANSNLISFHQKDGSGYRYMVKKIKEIDGYNSQVASRLTKSFSMISKLKGERKKAMQEALQWLIDSKISRDTFEVCSSYLKST